MVDTAAIRKKRDREKRTISQMVAIFCMGMHAEDRRTVESFCGELLCAECLSIDTYAVLRTEQCRKMDTKTICENCENRCYDPAMRESIRDVMRYAGPWMLVHHPIAAFRHLINKYL